MEKRKPIVFTLEGKEYSIKKVTPKQLSEARKIGLEEEDLYVSNVKQFCLLTGEKYSVVENYDVRDVADAIVQVSAALLGNEKNEPAEATSNE